MNKIIKEIPINTEYIKLDQLLKFSEVVDSGGIAKIFIKESAVKVNGEITTMRGKKIRSGDIVIVTMNIIDENCEDLYELKII
jgi:ribosome-associated protein